jgi:hypothetical protein
MQGRYLTYHKTSLVLSSHAVESVRAAATGEIDLHTAVDISPWDGKKFGITINCPDRTYYLKAGSETER